MLRALLDRMGFEPHRGQWEVLRDPHRFKLVPGGVRSGKSTLGAAYLVLQIMSTIEEGTARPGDLYWIVGPTYALTRREFRQAETFLGRLGVLAWSSKSVDPGRIELSRCALAAACGPGEQCDHAPIVIETKTARDAARLAADAPMGIVVAEAGSLDIEGWERVDERSAENSAWVYASGRFEGSLGWYPEKFTAWQSPAVQERLDARSFRFPSYANRAVFPGGREDPEILRLERDHSKEWFDEAVEGIPSPPRGRVFEEFRVELHVQEREFEPDRPVYVFVDPGYSRATESAYAVICYQEIDGALYGFDEVYEQELIGPEIIDIVMARPWWGRSEKIGVIDVAGMQHQAMPSQAEVWLRHAGLRMAGNRVGILDGIERLRSFLKPDPISGAPRISWSAKCQGIISELGGMPNPFDNQVKVYTWQMDNSGNMLGKVPRDRYNHSVKATIYGLVHLYGYARSVGDSGYRKAVVTYH